MKRVKQYDLRDKHGDENGSTISWKELKCDKWDMECLKNCKEKVLFTIDSVHGWRVDKSHRENINIEKAVESAELGRVVKLGRELGYEVLVQRAETKTECRYCETYGYHYQHERSHKLKSQICKKQWQQWTHWTNKLMYKFISFYLFKYINFTIMKFTYSTLHVKCVK